MPLTIKSLITVEIILHIHQPKNLARPINRDSEDAEKSNDYESSKGAQNIRSVEQNEV